MDLIKHGCDRKKKKKPERDIEHNAVMQIKNTQMIKHFART